MGSVVQYRQYAGFPRERRVSMNPITFSAAKAVFFPAADVAAEVGILLEEGERHIARLVDIKKQLDAEFVESFGHFAHTADAILVAAGQRGVKWEGRQLGENALRPDAVDTELLVGQQLIVGEKFLAVDVECALVQPREGVDHSGGESLLALEGDARNAVCKIKGLLAREIERRDDLFDCLRFAHLLLAERPPDDTLTPRLCTKLDV